jgi:branched-chain amino acid transport system substrate-binding protein
MIRNLLLAAVSAAALVTSAEAADVVRGVTPTEIIIGTYTDLSGVTAAWGVNNSNSYRLAFDEVNAKGGINGRKIKYIVEDNQYQVPRSIQAANKLINKDNVFAMVANGGTPMNNAVLPEQLEKGVPNFFPLTSARSMYEPLHHMKFGLLSSYYDEMRAGVKYFVEKKGKKSICAMYQDTDFGRDNMSGVYDQMTAMKLKLAGETTHKPTDTDFTASVAKLKDAKCDLLVLSTIVRDTNQIISAVRKSGWDVDIMGAVASYDTAVAEAPGNANDGYYCVTSFILVGADDKRPAVQEFLKSYRALYGKEPNPAAQVGYTGAQLLILALQNAGKDLTVDSAVAGMEKIKNYRDIFGSPAITFSATKHQGSDQSFLLQVKGGKWVAVVDGPIGYAEGS